MLYILPPPSGPTPPSPWPNILCNRRKSEESSFEKNEKNSSSTAASNHVRKRSGNAGAMIQRWLNSVQQNSLEKQKSSTSISKSCCEDSGTGSSLEDEDHITVPSRSLKEHYFARKSEAAKFAQQQMEVEDYSSIMCTSDKQKTKDRSCHHRHHKHHHHHRHHHHYHRVHHYHHHSSIHHESSSSSSLTSFCSDDNGSSSGSSCNSSCASEIAVRSRHRRRNSPGCDIQQHLQSMFSLLRPEETLKMAVKLESVHPGRTRYLVVVSCTGCNQFEECCLLGIDCNQCTTVGLVLRVLADTSITLDGDGGFSVSVCGRQHIFKPVSVQAMWSALQTLHKVSLKARECNFFEGGCSHEWVCYYEERIESDRSCLNEWHAMNDLESKRPPSPDSLRSKPRERLETERVIRNTLKEIMMSVDLDEVTSKYIRTRLEEQLDMDLREYKSFIDQEMLVILGQMDEATQIFPHVYLGSEWNASNLEELNKNGVCRILNVTREIDNFFPGMFDYLNIRVYDDDNTDLLKHWDNTYKYISKAKKDGSKVLVHCKMGVSRSASVVIAYAMKAYNWDLKKAFDYVRKKRSCIKPNPNFITQLETYEGMLDAMKNREKLQRSKSETNLKRASSFSSGSKCKENAEASADEVDAAGSKSQDEQYASKACRMLRVYSGSELARMSLRPKSWSPDNLLEAEIYNTSGTTSQSLEHLNVSKSYDSQCSSVSSLSTSPPNIPPAPPLPPVDIRYYNSNVRMPCSNGLTYSVSQNKIVQLYSSRRHSQETELEARSADDSPLSALQNTSDRQALVLNLTTQFEATNGCSPICEGLPPPVPTTEASLVKKDPPQDLEGKHASINDSVQKQLKKAECGPRNAVEHSSMLAFSKNSQEFSPNQGSPNSWNVSSSAYFSSRIAQAELVTNQYLYDKKGSEAVPEDAPQLVTQSAVENVSPCIVNTTQCSSVRHHTSLLEKLRNQNGRVVRKCESKDEESNRGMVSNLKREFEAKCQDSSKHKKPEDSKSLPSSPVEEHCKTSPSPLSVEDLSVRKLVGKYEVVKTNSWKDTVESGGNTKQHQTTLFHKNHKIPPTVKSFLTTPSEIRTTVTKAANKLQQSRTNPLSRLNFCKQRLSNTVYNTM